MFYLHLLFFAIFTFLTPVARADYTIDDSNYSTLKFSENPSGPVWGPFGSDTGEVLSIRLPNGTMQTINSAQCYDGTYTYAACQTSDNCAVEFSFTGSGITIYVLQAGPQGMSASLSIDSGSATTSTLDAPPAPQYNIPQVTLFSVQNLVSGTHTALMTVLTWNGGISGMMLDYIDVNQAVVAAPTSNPAQSTSSTPSATTATPTSLAQTTSGSASQTTSGASSAASASIVSIQTYQISTGTASPSTASGSSTGAPPVSSSSSSSKKTNVAVVAGGVAGGVAGLLGLAVLAICCFRRRRHIQSLNDRPSPLLRPGPESRFTDSATENPFASTAAISMSRLPGASRPLQAWTESDAASNFAAGRDPTMSSPTGNLSHMRATSSGNDSSAASAPSPTSAAVSSADVGNSAFFDVGAAAAGAPQESSSPTRPLPVPGSSGYPNEKLRQPSLHSVSASVHASPDVPPARPNPTLTDGQADFVNSLFNNNVPAPVIARVLERMLANPQGGSGTGANDPELRAHFGSDDPPAGPWSSGATEFGDGETTFGTAPPSYDFVRAQ